MRQRLLFPVLFFGLAAFAWGETIINEAAPQPDAPVRILATFATAEDLGGQVDFKNFPNRAVKQIQVAWVIEVPTSCGSSGRPVGYHESDRHAPAKAGGDSIGVFFIESSPMNCDDLL